MCFVHPTLSSCSISCSLSVCLSLPSPVLPLHSILYLLLSFYHHNSFWLPWLKPRPVCFLFSLLWFLPDDPEYFLPPISIKTFLLITMEWPCWQFHYCNPSYTIPCKAKLVVCFPSNLCREHMGTDMGMPSLGSLLSLIREEDGRKLESHADRGQS